MGKSNLAAPKVSVILPVYNGEKFLDESINSVLNQTFKDFELIIVNDCSTDNSLKIIKRYMKKDKRIILINNPKNLGLQKSLNKGLKISKEKYIARMDADDISLPNRLQLQVNYLEKNRDIFLIGSSAIVIDEDGKRIGVFKKFDNYRKVKRKLLKNNHLIHPSIIFRNSREFFYREKFKTSEDYDFYLRILSSGKKITNLPEFLIKYRIHKKSFVSTMPNQDFYFNKAKEFYLQRMKFNQDLYSKLISPKNNTFPKNTPFNNTRIRIFIKLLDGQSKEVRELSISYFKRHNFNKIIFFYWVLSFSPKKFIYFLQENF
jgi:glycosyltransferase involved in cell wall biosynthesis